MENFEQKRVCEILREPENGKSQVTEMGSDLPSIGRTRKREIFIPRIDGYPK